ncbi:23S rRNA (uracil(1939)-C(5))-methyltransferase RlmD [Nanoarchaeota archaeon]
MVEPKCPYFGKCGGCSSQHIDYSLQVENKKKQLVGLIGSDDVAVFSGEPYGYRNRMDFVFHDRGVGFRKKGDWKTIIDIKDCPIANARVNSLLGEVREAFSSPDSFDVRKKKGTFRYAVIRAPSGGASISFVLNSDSSRIGEAVELIKSFAEKSSAENVVVTYVKPDTDTSISDDYFVVKGDDTLRESYLGNEFMFPVQGFFQNNHAVASLMHKHVRKVLSGHDTKDAHLLDVYAGVGTFGINNASLFSSVHIVEGYEKSIDFAKKNIEVNKVGGASAVALDDKQLSRLDLPSQLFVITDPPRSGMNPKAIQQINRLEPEVIVYISCNPAQLGKDLSKFRHHSLKSAALFDMFPQTPHCEAVVELVKKG